MATDMGKLQKLMNIIWPITCKRDAYKKEFTKIHDRFLREHVFRERMFDDKRDEDVCRKWGDLAEEDHTYRMSESEYFHYRQNWWISLNKSGNTTEPMRKRSNFNQALSTINRLHREVGGRQLRPTPYWKYQPWKSSSSSSSSWWQWSESWWSSQENQRKSTKEDYDRTGQPVVHRSLANTSDEWLSRIHSLFTDRSLQLTSGTVTDGDVKTTLQQTRFRNVKYARSWDTDWVDDHSDKNTIDDIKHEINTMHNTKPNNVSSDLKQWENTWADA